MAFKPQSSATGAVYMAGMEEEKMDSTYFVPNLVIKEPIFIVPPIPHLTKVPPPVVRVPPKPGFDMRTLRAQVVELNNEIAEREETQNLLYQQNEQLWAYIQQLMQANKANAQLMREEVVKLHAELKTAHQERFNIAEKLQLARNSKQMLLELNQELQGAQLTVEEVARRKREAEEALLQAKEENAHLEAVLRSQVEEMAGVNHQLDEYRKRRLEEQALDLADDFFFTNKTILRAAYYRFRSGVQRRFKLNRIMQAITSVASVQLKQYYFVQWCGFLHRKRIMYRNQARRRGEKLVLCMQRWKVYTALERYFTRTRRKQLMKRVFSAWKTDAQETAYDRWAEKATAELHRLQFKRKIFAAWRSRTMFLAWNSPMVHLLAQEARVHHLRRLLRAWALQAQRSRQDLAEKASLVPGVVQWWHLTRWRELCEQRWRRRGKLLRRFFRNLRERVAARADDAVSRRWAYSGWVRYRQRKVLWRWQQYMKVRRLYINVPTAPTVGFAPLDTLRSGDNLLATYGSHSAAPASAVSGGGSGGRGLYIDTHPGASVGTPVQLMEHLGSPTYTTASALTAPTQPLLGALVGSLGHAMSTGLIGGRKIAQHRRGRPSNRWQVNRTLQVLSHMKVRWLRASVLQWVVRSMVLRRQRVCGLAGQQHHSAVKALAALLRWRDVVRTHVDRRQERRRFLLQTIVDGWKAHTAECQAARRLQEGLAALQARVLAHQQSRTIAHWAAAVRAKKRIAHCAEYLRWHRQKLVLRRTFTQWRGAFAKQAFWKLKELTVELDRARALHALQQQTMHELQAEQQRATEQAQVLEQGVISLQEALADANNSNREQERLIAAKEAEKAEALHTLEALQRELHDALMEQEQMRTFEEVLTRELQAQETERSLLRQAAAEAVARVHQHADSLRDEVATAREHALGVERAAELEYRRGKEAIEELQYRAEETQQRVLNKRQQLLALEGEHAGLLDGLGRVQLRLSEVARDGAALIAENEALIRAKGSANRIHKSNIGLKEARVQELQNLLGEFDLERTRTQLHTNLQQDESELQQLIAMQRQLESGALRAGAAATSPTAGKGVSLYHNVLTPTAAPAAKQTSSGGHHSAGSHGGSGGRRAVERAGSTPAAAAAGAGRSSGGPGGKRTTRYEKPQMPHVHNTTVAAPTPPILTPHAQAREGPATPGIVTAGPSVERRDPLGRSIFDLLAPGHHLDAAARQRSPPRQTVSVDNTAQSESGSSGSGSGRKVPSPRVHPAPVAPKPRMLNNYTANDAAPPSGPVYMASSVNIRVPAAVRTHSDEAAPTTWSSDGNGRFTPPVSPSKAFPRSPPTFLTAALDSESESSQSPAVAPLSVEREHNGHRAEQPQRVQRQTTEISLGSDSPASQAYSDHAAPAAAAEAGGGASGHHNDHYYYGDDQGEDEGSSFDGVGQAEEEVDEAEFRYDSGSDQSSY